MFEITGIVENEEINKDLDFNYGSSAYEIAIKNGFKGSESEWLDSLKGKDGVNGKDGKDGINGKDGRNGKDGIDGRDGTTGKEGTPGKDGFGIFQTIVSIPPATDIVKPEIRFDEVNIPSGYTLKTGDLIISNNVDSIGRVAVITSVWEDGFSYDYFCDLKGSDGVTPDMSNYATNDYVDTLIGDVESVLNEVV